MPASRSLIALLVGTVAFFALWLFALKPGSSSSGGGSSSSQGLGQYQSDINKAHQAVQISGASNAASGNDGTAGSSSSSTAGAQSSAAPAPSTAKASTHVTLPASGSHKVVVRVHLSTVQHALAAHKVVAMLFYNPAAADDQAVKQELATVPTHRRHVVKLAVPLSQAAVFTPVTQQVPLNFSPTLVLIGPNGQAGEIVGFSDRFEIAQRVDDALAAK
jgi:hypothetical protein